MTDLIVKDVGAPAQPKVTAAQIEANCDRLQEIGKEITERFKKAQNADDHIDAIKALIDEAECGKRTLVTEDDAEAWLRSPPSTAAPERSSAREYRGAL